MAGIRASVDHPTLRRADTASPLERKGKRHLPGQTLIENPLSLGRRGLTAIKSLGGRLASCEAAAGRDVVDSAVDARSNCWLA